MTDPNATQISRAQKIWAFLAALVFLTAIGFLGFALNTGVMRGFAIGWLALQLFGFIGAIKITKGDTAHPLFISQVMIHLIGFVLLIVLIVRAL